MKKNKIACAALLAAALFSFNGLAWAAEAAPQTLLPVDTVEVTAQEPVTVKALFKQLVNNEAGGYLLVESQPDQVEIRLEFGDELLLVDAETGFLVDWADVPLGSLVLVNYKPDLNQLNYLVTNFDNDAPAGLFTVEETAGLLTTRLLVNNGSLWIEMPKEAWQRPEGFNEMSLVVGTQFLVWYDEVSDGYPAEATATRLRNIFSQQEVQYYRQKKIRDDMYYNAEQTRHLLAGETELRDVVRYVHGEPYLPLRRAAESLGFTVEWNETEQAVYLNGFQVQAKIVAYDRVYFAIDGRNDVYYGLPREYDGEICVPAKLFEIFGADVEVSEQTMIIKFN